MHQLQQILGISEGSYLRVMEQKAYKLYKMKGNGMLLLLEGTRHQEHSKDIKGRFRI